MDNEKIRKDEIQVEETNDGEMSKEEYRRYLGKLSSAITAGWLFLHPLLKLLLEPRNLFYICALVLGSMSFSGFLLNHFSSKKGSKKMKTVGIIMMSSSAAGLIALYIIGLINYL